ncbi:hypothetical protein D3C81_1969260 [compost metagenome]
MGLADAQPCQPRQRLVQQQARQPASTEGLFHQQMLQVAAPPIMAGQQAADHLALMLQQQAQAGIAFEVSHEGLIFIVAA